METARAALKQYFGYDDFRPGQVDVVASVLHGKDTLGVLPTGGGKSLCYQVPALVLPGVTVVISPLISLMKDQVDRLGRHGVAATLINSTLGAAEVSHRLACITRGEIRLLYVAPERFEAPDLQRCLGKCTLALLAVDEAHCISEWGHDFRPSFRRIADTSRKLRFPQTIALTATATPAVRQDIVRQLRLRQPRIVVSGFDRENLQYAVRECRNDDDKIATLMSTLRAATRPAIVYASTRSTVERIAKVISRTGIAARAYHGGLDDEHRHEVQDAFMSGRLDTIVATNAFGMGIDKPNVRLVVHYAMPGTLEAYYQEAGRAGRDGLAGRCVLLHAFRDRFTHEWFIRGMFPDRAVVERTYAAMRASHEGGLVRVKPGERDAEAAIRLLEHEQAVVRHAPDRTNVRVRLLATPDRIARELAGPGTAMELGMLRALWRAGGDGLRTGCIVRLDGLPPGIGGRTARPVLERLRDRQFVDFTDTGGGLYLACADAPLDRFHIDWKALDRRGASERAKLDMMQAYCYTRICRRAFVLRYFGEPSAKANCGGCDNCLRD